ncbi:hypothetical protein ACUN5M_000311 [Acinetobacter baumannii]
MTDLNKEREAFELFELNKRPCATPASLFERFDSNELGEDEKHYVGKYVDSYMQEKWELWQKAKAQTVPDTHFVVPRSREVVVAIEKMVEQQVEASGITSDVFRLDGWRILDAIQEASESGAEG